MTCDAMEAKLAEILAGEAQPDREVEAHLLDCANCRRDFETARAGWKAAEVLPSPKVPTALVDRVRRRVLAAAGGGFFRWATAAAAAVLVGLLLFQLVPVRQSPPHRTVVRATPPPARVELMAPEGGVGMLVTKDAGDLSIVRQSVQVEILDGVSKTTVEEVFYNETNRRLEGTFYFPLPPNASISRLAMEINGKLEEGVCLEREKAREVYEGIVRRMQDPALLEWMPGGIFKCRIFPIEARSEKRIILSYTQALPMKSGKTQYVYPLSAEHPIGNLTIDFAVKFGAKVRNVTCRTHAIDIEKKNDFEARGSFEGHNVRPKKDFVLDVELEGGNDFVFLPHKVDGEDGWFLVAFTPQAEAKKSTARNVAVIVDASASVNSKELEVSRQIVAALPFESVTIFAHDVDVRKVTLAELATLETSGASNVKKAFDAAIAEKPDEIIYLGEGVPTMGPERFDLAFEGTIRTVAVGSDAASTLLEELAQKHGGVSFAVSPSDDLKTRVPEVVEGLTTAVIRDVAVEATEGVYELAPQGRRNCLAGERLVLTGRWRKSEAVLSIGGRDFPLAFPAKHESNNYVKRLWAQRKIGDLLVDEAQKTACVQLSEKYQVMTPYTSFLVLENEQAWEKEAGMKHKAHNEDKLLTETEKKPAKTDPVAGKSLDGRFRSEAEGYRGYWDLPLRGGEYDIELGERIDAVLSLRNQKLTGSGETQFGTMINSIREPNRSDIVLRRRGYVAVDGIGLTDLDETVEELNKLTENQQRAQGQTRDGERSLEQLQKEVELAISGRVTVVETSRITIDIGQAKRVQKGMLFAVTREKRFIAVIVITDVQEQNATAEVWQGMQVGPILAGDQAAFIPDPDAFVRAMPAEVLKDLVSLKNIERMNRNVELERALEK